MKLALMDCLTQGMSPLMLINIDDHHDPIINPMATHPVRLWLNSYFLGQSVVITD